MPNAFLGRNSAAVRADRIAKPYGGQGIDVPCEQAAYLAIDAVLDLPWTRRRSPDAPDEFFCNPDEMAGEVRHLAHQPKSAWSFDVTIRPFAEKW